jgi:hypothetical protein
MITHRHPEDAKRQYHVGATSEAIEQQLSHYLKAGENDQYILDLRGRYFRGRYLVTAVRAAKIGEGSTPFSNTPPPRGNR